MDLNTHSYKNLMRFFKVFIDSNKDSFRKIMGLISGDYFEFATVFTCFVL